MIDYHSTLVSALNTILPTHYEMTLAQGTKTPCLSYLELNNSVDANCNILGYNRINYQVKVWGHDISEIQHYAQLVDAKLRELGWTRIGANELSDRNSTMIQKVLSYEKLIAEQY